MTFFGPHDDRRRWSRANGRPKRLGLRLENPSRFLMCIVWHERGELRVVSCSSEAELRVRHAVYFRTVEAGVS